VKEPTECSRPIPKDIVLKEEDEFLSYDDSSYKEFALLFILEHGVDIFTIAFHGAPKSDN